MTRKQSLVESLRSHKPPPAKNFEGQLTPAQRHEFSEIVKDISEGRITVSFAYVARRIKEAWGLANSVNYLRMYISEKAKDNAIKNGT